jgi:protein-disulfide isomerase-like protein with CxxC motif
LEVTFFEDPACCWCWAFRPVSAVFDFELGGCVRIRRVMGGLRDRPAADAEFIVNQWRKAENVSGMPFDPEVWKVRVLRTTFTACRAVKAAAILDEDAGLRLLRRLQEAFYTERIPIDDLDTILPLALECGIDQDGFVENLASGRAEALFARDREEAARYGFGFPTILIRSRAHETETILQGAVPYAQILQALTALGLPLRERRRFRDTPDCWKALFALRGRYALPELQMVAGMKRSALAARLKEMGVEPDGALYRFGARLSPAGPDAPPVSSSEGAAPAGEELAAAEPPPATPPAPARPAASPAFTAPAPRREAPVSAGE